MTVAQSTNSWRMDLPRGLTKLTLNPARRDDAEGTARSNGRMRCWGRQERRDVRWSAQGGPNGRWCHGKYNPSEATNRRDPHGDSPRRVSDSGLRRLEGDVRPGSRPPCPKHGSPTTEGAKSFLGALEPVRKTIIVQMTSPNDHSMALPPPEWVSFGRISGDAPKQVITANVTQSGVI
jgi:hypothetical protein